jgi:hypothetical protein
MYAFLSGTSGKAVLAHERTITLTLPSTEHMNLDYLDVRQVSLSALGILSVCLSNVALVVDVCSPLSSPLGEENNNNKDADTSDSTLVRAIFLRPEKEETLSTKAARKQRRCITTVSVIHPQGSKRDTDPTNTAWYGSLVIGSDKGEYYAIDWYETGGVRDVDHCPAIEPLFGIHYKNGRLILHTVMALCITTGSTDGARLIPTSRPMALDSCGGLIFVLTKYLSLDIYSMLAEQVRRTIKAPTAALNMRAPTMQVAYAGIRAYEDYVVVLYPNGVVRRFALA